MLIEFLNYFCYSENVVNFNAKIHKPVTLNVVDTNYNSADIKDAIYEVLTIYFERWRS